MTPSLFAEIHTACHVLQHPQWQYNRHCRHTGNDGLPMFVQPAHRVLQHVWRLSAGRCHRALETRCSRLVTAQPSRCRRRPSAPSFGAPSQASVNPSSQRLYGFLQFLQQRCNTLPTTNISCPSSSFSSFLQWHLSPLNVSGKANAGQYWRRSRNMVDGHEKGCSPTHSAADAEQPSPGLLGRLPGASGPLVGQAPGICLHFRPSSLCDG